MNKLEVFLSEDPVQLIGSAKDIAERTRISLSDVERFLNLNPIIRQVSEIHKQKKKGKNYNSITAPGVGQVQMDLMDMTKIKRTPGNKRMGWALVIIDVYSRYAIIIPIKSKTASDVLTGIQKAYKEFAFTTVLTDEGKEFLNHQVQDFFEKNNIQHSTIVARDGHHKLGIVDRFIRTIRNTLRKLWELNDNFVWVPYIDKIVDNYNNRVHSTTKNKPIDIFEGKVKNLQIIHRDETLHNFSLGDKVRKRLKRGIFEKGGDIFSKKIYHVVGRDKFKIVLDDYSRNRPDDLLKTELENVDEKKTTYDKEKELTKKRQTQKLKRLDIDSKNITRASRRRR